MVDAQTRCRQRRAVVRPGPRLWVTAVALGVTLATWLPYLLAWAVAPWGSHFTGLLYNPLDGHTYIAKMRLGAEGSWLFRLTYSAELQLGAPIYLFYLLLGHVARWSGLSLLAVYHAARTLGGLVLVFGIHRLAGHLAEGLDQQRLLFLLAVLGGGLGWLAAPLGLQTPDLWVAEAFPFLAMLTNAHFPFALALLVWAAQWALRAEVSWLSGLGLVGAAILLGAVQPFGLVPLLGGLAGLCLVSAIRQRCLHLRNLLWVALAVLTALPYPLYTLWVVRTDAVLAAWNRQNLTPSPAAGHWVLGFGLLGVLALGGFVLSLRRARPADGLLLGWLLATVVGLALPLGLARRLSLGLGVAVGLLGGLGWEQGGRLVPALRRMSRAALVAFSLLTPAFLLVLGAVGALGGHPLLYLSQGEWAALKWLETQASHQALVLAAPQTGIFIPAWAGQRVLYGHPFETVNAQARRAEVERYWAGERKEAWLDQLGVDYVFYGPRERALGGPPEGQVVFVSGDTTVYRR